MENKISIQKENLLKAYYRATLSQKALLEDIFGEEMFQPKDIKERVKTFEDACNALGEENQFVKAYREWMRVGYVECKDITAYLKLRIIAFALNEGWEPLLTEEHTRWYPWFRLWTGEELADKSEKWKADNNLWRFGGRSRSASRCGLAAAHSGSAWPYSSAHSSARLAVKSEELAEYFGNQFIDIWADYLFA